MDIDSALKLARAALADIGGDWMSLPMQTE